MINYCSWRLRDPSTSECGADFPTRQNRTWKVVQAARSWLSDSWSVRSDSPQDIEFIRGTSNSLVGFPDDQVVSGGKRRRSRSSATGDGPKNGDDEERKRVRCPSFVATPEDYDWAVEKVRCRCL